MAVFRIFLSNAFCGFSGFGKEVTSSSRAKIVISSDHIKYSTVSSGGMDDKYSLFSSLYLGRNGCQTDYEKPKIISKQKIILKYHVPAMISCGL